MVIGGPCDQQAIAFGDAAQERPALLGVVPVVDFQACQAGVDHLPVGPLPHDPAAGGCHGVGEHRHAPRRTDQFDGERRLRRIVLDPVARTCCEDGTKSLGPVFHHTGRDERVGDVRAAQGGPRRDVVNHVVPCQRVVLRQKGDHLLRPRVPGVLGLGDFLKQSGMRGVVEVAEQVDADAFRCAAGDLHPRDQRDPGFPGGDGGLRPPGSGIVVGQGDDVEARGGGGLHDAGRRLGAVGNVGVRMQVNPHLTSLVDGSIQSLGPVLPGPAAALQRERAVGLSRGAGETMGR